MSRRHKVPIILRARLYARDHEKYADSIELEGTRQRIAAAWRNGYLAAQVDQRRAHRAKNR